MIELNKIYNENCLITMSERIPDNFVDLTVTSPPYDKTKDYKGFKFPFKHIARHLYRVTKHGGIIVWVVGDSTVNGSESGTSFRQCLFFIECGFRLHDTMIYRKHNFVPLTHNRYEQEWEYMFVLSKGRPNTFNPIKIPAEYGGTKTWGKPKVYKTRSDSLTQIEGYVIYDNKIKGNIFEYATGSTTESAKINHPAIFPEELAKDQIFSWSNEGEIVFDPFSGSGTTCKMAQLQNRKWIGSEISDRYFYDSEKRIAPYLAQTTLFR